MEHRPLRVGLIVDSLSVPVYIADLVAGAAVDPLISICCLIVQDTARPPAPRSIRLWRFFRRSGPGKFLGVVIFTLVTRLEQFLLRSDEVVRRHSEMVSLEDEIPQTITVRPDVSTSRFVYRYSPEDLELIREAGLDVLVRCGSGILRGGILTVAPLGIVSFHHGDNRLHRGGPSGFWETFRREPSTGFIIQRLTEELDGGRVLNRGNFMTQKFYVRNQSHLFAKSNPFMLRTLDLLAVQRESLPEEPQYPFDAQLDLTPSPIVTLHYWLVSLGWLAMAALRRSNILNIREEFHVAIARGNWQTTVLRRSKTLTNPAGRFLADPFVTSVDGRTCLFVEDCDFKTNKGYISVYELLEDGPVLLGRALEEPFHLSFPYIFNFDGRLFMCPETIDADSVRVYECVSFPLVWQHRETVIEGLRAADPMIFQEAEKWWMLVTLDLGRNGDFDSCLALFSAEHPLSTNWVAHESTPLVVDSQGGRNGGLLTDGSNWFRVAQRQGFASYGEAVSLRRIESITSNKYSEREVHRVLPMFAPAVKGLHHFHSNGEWTVFDFKTKSLKWFGRI